MTVSRLYSYGFPFARPTGLESNLQWAVSEKFMLEDLAKSGLVPEDLGAYPLCLIKKETQANAAYVIPYVGRDGKYLASPIVGTTGHMHRIRMSYPDTLGRAELRELPKYKQPTRLEIGAAAIMPYIPAICRKEVGGTLFIVEGEKKAAAFIKRWALPCMAIGGNSMWVNPDPHGDKLHPDIRDLVLDQRYDNILIIPDGDVRRVNISREYKGLANSLFDLGKDVQVVNFSLFTPDKLDDWLMANPSAGSDVIEQWPFVDINHMAENVRDLIDEYLLLYKENAQGTRILLANEANMMSLLQDHPAFKGLIRVNEDTLTLDKDVTAMDVTTELQTNFSMSGAKLAMVKSVVAATAENNPYSPLADWLRGLVWDRKLRLAKWMSTCLGAEDTPYCREVAAKSLIAAVARRLRPGCIVDFMTILYGAQGIGKSSAIRIIFGEANTWEYSRGSINGKDFLLAAHMAWCSADEELGSLSDSVLNHMKAQITTRSDLIRMPYGTETKRYPRRHVWWGSTNTQECLPQDDSGQRRYAVVEVKQVDFKRLEAVREQLWAEAAYRYKQGVGYANITGTSEHVQQYVMGGVILEQVEGLARLWWKTAGSEKQVTDHEGQQYFWLQMTQLFGLGNIEPWLVRGYRGREYSSAMLKLGFRKVRQKFIKGEHYNSVYLYPYRGDIKGS